MRDRFGIGWLLQMLTTAAVLGGLVGFALGRFTAF
jgi:membrane protein YqaA with SNARE-associated domain